MGGSRIPNLRHLRAVETVARFGSVSRASAHIHVSQPAVTQAIAKLEAQLGISLFDRRATGSYPTELGRIFIDRMSRFFAMAARALDELYAARPGPARLPGRSVEHVLTGTQIRSLIATTSPDEAIDQARAIGVSTKSLYRSARELEQAIGRPLYKKSAHGLVTNMAGTELARKLRVALREIEYGIGEVAAARGNGATCITVGVLPMSGSFAIGAALNHLTETCPNAYVKVVDGTYLSLLNKLRGGEVDLVFGLLRSPDWVDDVAEEALFEDSFCVVVRRGHPLTRVHAPQGKQLAAYEWVVSAPGTPRRREIDRLFDGIEPPRLGVETSSVAVIRALLSESDRISVLSKSEVVFDERAGILSILPVRLGTQSLKGITTRADWLATSTHLRFIEALRRSTAVQRPRLQDLELEPAPRRRPVELAEELARGS